MRPCTPIPLLRVLVPLMALALAPNQGWAQSGVLQQPAKTLPDTPPKPPSAAPRAPVQQVAPHAAPTSPVVKPPVVKPFGEVHAQKPPAGPAGHKPATPEPPVPPALQVPAPPVLAAPTEAPAAGIAKPTDDKPAGLDEPPIPRFASIRSDKVNLRIGPGVRYRIDWVYTRPDLPVEILRKIDVWYLVRDPDGVQGWVSTVTLSGRRNVIVQGADAPLRDEPKETGSVLATLKPGVIGRLQSCEKTSDWCKIQIPGHKGYLKRSQFWGLLPDEIYPK